MEILKMDGKNAIDGRPNGRVKLHDVVRDIVIFIASNLDDDQDRMHNIRTAAELEEYFDKEMFEDSKMISLYGLEFHYP